jgi:hypothetical protein
LKPSKKGLNTEETELIFYTLFLFSMYECGGKLEIEGAAVAWLCGPEKWAGPLEKT